MASRFSIPLPLLLAGAVTAQGAVGLRFISGPTPSTAFSPATLGNGITGVGQVSMIRHPNGTPGLYLGGMSVLGLSTALGGKGGFDVVAFTYSRGTDRATLNANAAAFNTAGDDFAFNWGLDGTYAVADRAAGVFQARATTAGGVLSAPVAVAGVGAAWVDPCPSRIGGQSVLFFSNPAGGIAWRAHDVANARLTGTTTLVTAKPAGTDIAHSVFPMVGADGDAEALIAAQADNQYAASDWNWQGDLDPATRHIVQQPTPVPFEGNLCEAGGRVYVPQSVTTYTVLEFQVIGLLGDTVRASGGTAEFTAFAPTKASGTPDVTAFVLGSGFLASPTAIPGIAGQLGLDPLGALVLLGYVTHSNATGRAVFSAPTPPLGVGVIPVQAVTTIGGGGGSHFTSTAVLRIVP